MLTHWGEMTAADFAALDERSVAILPVAATEQHGAHLPTGTDAFILDGILRAAAGLAGPVRGIVLPLQPIGWSPEHGGLPRQARCVGLGGRTFGPALRCQIQGSSACSIYLRTAYVKPVDDLPKLGQAWIEVRYGSRLSWDRSPT